MSEELKLNDLKLETMNIGEMIKLRRKYGIEENPHDVITAKLCSVINALENTRQPVSESKLKDICHKWLDEAIDTNSLIDELVKELYKEGTDPAPRQQIEEEL